MKRAFSFLLIALLLCSLAVHATAAGETVVYTSDSSFVAGGTVKVNEQKTKQNIMDPGKNDDQSDKGMSRWGILLIALAAAGAGVGITVLVLKKKK